MIPNAFIDERLGELRQAHYSAAGWRHFAGELWRRAQQNAAARPELRRELARVRWLGVGASLGVGVLMLAEHVAPPLALLPQPITWLVLTAWVKAELGLVRHPMSGVPSPAIGPANVMTLYRGWAAVPVMVLGLTLGGPSPLWVGLAVAAGATDLVDGTVAMRLGQESRLGRLLDPVLDALFFSAASVSLARWHLVPWWLATLVTLRYFLPVIGGIVLLFALGRSLPVRHTPWGQRSTLAVGTALFMAWLASVAPVPQWALLALDVVALLTMALALVGILRRLPSRGATLEAGS